MPTRPHEYQLLLQSTQSTPVGHVAQAGRIKNSTGVGPNPMRVFGQYALVYLIDGSGMYRDAKGRAIAVESGDAIFIFPELAHSYAPEAGGRWTEIYLTFEGLVFDLWRKRGLLDDQQPVRQLRPLEDWTRRILKVASGSEPMTSLQRVCALLELLSTAIATTVSARSDEDRALIDRACALLSSDLTRRVDLYELADDLGVSYDVFRKTFHRVTGNSPGRYRARLLIEEACRLLAETSLTHRQIAGRLGFCDEYHLSRRFREVTGQAPRDYRKQVRRLE